MSLAQVRFNRLHHHALHPKTNAFFHRGPDPRYIATILSRLIRKRIRNFFLCDKYNRAECTASAVNAHSTNGIQIN